MYVGTVITEDLKSMAVLEFGDEPRISRMLATFETDPGSCEWAFGVITYRDHDAGVSVLFRLWDLEWVERDFELEGNEAVVEAMVAHRVLWLCEDDPTTAEEPPRGVPLFLCEDDVRNLQALLSSSSRVA